MMALWPWSLPQLAFALLFRAGVAASNARGLDILERMLEPMARQDFLARSFERHWAYFPHNVTVAGFDLADVSEWMQPKGGGSEALEVLTHPHTGETYKRRKDLTALEAVQDAFLKGHSMVINSLHEWSQPGLRFARELYEAIDMPVDMYMYLAPPRSRSYGLHCDEMDAFMVQVAGSKTWRVCEKRDFSGGQGRGVDPSSCSEVIMKGGDVMYVPFSTLHQAHTEDDLSAHLTVNVERQFYVWGHLFVVLMHKAVSPNLRVTDFMKANVMESDMGQFVWRFMSAVPRLAMLPLGELQPDGASRWLVRSVSTWDLPATYLGEVAAEYGSLLSELQRQFSRWPRKQAARSMRIGNKRLSGEDALASMPLPSDLGTLRWALEVLRVHSITHFGKALPGKPELFSTLASLRSGAGDIAQRASVDSMGKLAVTMSSGLLFARRPSVRAALLLEDDDSADLGDTCLAITTGPAMCGQSTVTLIVNAEKIQIPAAQLPAAHYCLGLFGEGTAQGRPFSFSDVPSGGVSNEDLERLLHRLFKAGVLEVVPSKSNGPGTP